MNEPSAFNEPRSLKLAPPTVSEAYRALNLTTDAEFALVRETYWLKVRMARTVDDGGVDVLNSAYAVILDHQQAHGTGADERPIGVPITLPSPAKLSIAVMAFGVGVLVASTAAEAHGLPLLAGWLILLSFATGIFGRRRVSRLVGAVHRTALHLTGWNAQEQIDLAYRIQAEQLVARLPYDASAAAELDELDGVYAAAVAQLWDATYVNDLPRSYEFGADDGRLGDPADGHVGSGVAALFSRGRARLATPRRRRGGARTIAERLRSSSIGLAESARPSEATGTFVCFAGANRLVGENAVTIGTASTCDLRLPAESGALPEQAVLWRRSGTLILHVIDDSRPSLVNGRSALWAVLEAGDRLEFGDATITVMKEEHERVSEK